MKLGWYEFPENVEKPKGSFQTTGNYRQFYYSYRSFWFSCDLTVPAAKPQGTPAAGWVAESGEAFCFKRLQTSLFKGSLFWLRLLGTNIYQGMFSHHSNLHRLRVVCANTDQMRRVVWNPTGIVASLCVTPPRVIPLESWEIGDVRLGACWQSQLSNLTGTTFKPSLNPAGKCHQAVRRPVNTDGAALLLIQEPHSNLSTLLLVLANSRRSA